jgi:predicted phage-related endonuclease
MYEKLGAEPDYPEEPAGYLERGTALEPIVADLAAEHFGVRLRRPGILPSGVAPEWWKGNPDRIVVPDGVWEGKTMHPIRFKRLRSEGMPPDHTLQVQHYIKQTDRKYGLYSVLEPVSWSLHHEEIKRDDDLIGRMIEAGEMFWQLRLERKLPAKLDPGDSRCRRCPFRMQCQGAALFDAVPELAPGELEQLNDPELVELLMERDQLDAVLSEANALKDANSALIRQLLGGPRKVQAPNGRAVYWIAFERKTLDTKAIRAQYPEIYDAHVKASVVNQLRVY